MLDYVIVALIILGFLGIVLNTMVGGGAGVLLIPLLILFFGQSTNNAIATSLAVITVGAVASTLAYSRQGRIDYKIGTLLGCLTLPGVALGTFLSTAVEGRGFDFMLGLLIVIISVLTLISAPSRLTESKLGWNRKISDSFGTKFDYTVDKRILVLSAVATGILTGIFGAGAGLVLTPALVLAGLPIHIAIGTMRLAAIVLGLGASLARFSLGQMDLTFAFWLSLGGIGGAFLGARLVKGLRSAWLRKIVSVIIFLLGLALIIRSL